MYPVSAASRRVSAYVEIECLGGLQRQAEVEFRVLGIEQRRARGKHEQRVTVDRVEAAIRQADRLQSELGRQQPAARLSRNPAHFENVGEVGGEFDRHERLDRALSVIGEAQALVERGLPDETDPLDVNDAFRCRVVLATSRQRTIRRIAAEEHVVVADRRAQQRGRRKADCQNQPRQHPGVVAEESVRSAADVAERICDDERVVVLERIRADRPAGSFGDILVCHAGCSGWLAL
jgi:hypothetical protein